jgi:erythritol kinase
MAILCIDAGTTMIKTVAFDRHGGEITLARQQTEVLRPKPGYSEQDMMAVWDAVVFTIRAATHQLHEKVEMIALTGQGDGCWLIDAAGRPTGHAILWNDGRAAPIVERWSEAGIPVRVFQINGSAMFAGLQNAILTWLKENEPQRVERAYKSLYGDGWIFFNLTGEAGVDESDAAAPFLDIRTRHYSPDLLALYGLEWAERLLPEVRGNDRRAAPLQPSAASALGLPPGLPVVMAPYDIAAMAIGSGAVGNGQACSILGTTLCTEMVTDQVITEGEPTGFTIALGVPGKYLRAFPTLAGVDVITWAQKLLELAEPEDLSRLARHVAPGASGLAFMPYLSPAGERAPFLNPNARGILMGLTFEHNRNQIARAILEGLTLVIRDCFVASKAAPNELYVCGGGANSQLWRQLIADITGVPTFRPADSEVGAKGAFITGLVVTGAESDFAAAAKSYVRISDVCMPDKERSARYVELYQEFLDLRRISTAIWSRLARRTPRSEAVAVGGTSLADASEQ